MAEGRMINRRIAKSDKLAALKKDRSRVLYFMIYPFLDVEGRYSGDPRDIKEDCVPRLKYSIRQIAESIIDLDSVDLLELYTDNKSQVAIQYTRFDDFQNLRRDREGESKISPPPAQLPEKSRSTPALYLSLSLSLRNIKNTSKAGISFDFVSKKFTGITEEDIQRWKTAFPACDVKLCLSQMAEWILSNPAKGKKSNYPKFITNWLKREQDKGGSLRGWPGKQKSATDQGREWAEKHVKEHGLIDRKDK